MQTLAGEPCYTTHEIVNRLKPHVSLKRLEYLRSLRLLPPPIKVGTGNGTIGYYPEPSVQFLQVVEREHKTGTPYPNIVVKYQDKIEVIEAKSESIRRKYQAEKRLRKQLGWSLIVGKQPQHSIKAFPSGKTVDLARIDKERQGIKDALRVLFKDADGLSMTTLSRIRLKIERLEELEAVRGAAAQLADYFEAWKQSGDRGASER